MAIFNPLNDVQDTMPDLGVSTSSMLNDVVGTCPKCKQPFGSGIVNGDEVYYCDKCRVSHPLPK